MAIDMTATTDNGAGTRPAPIPRWLTALTADYAAGVAKTFLLHGNVNDYVPMPGRANLTVRDYLATRLMTSRSARPFDVIQFSPDEGITFSGSDIDQRRTRARLEAVLTGGQQAPMSEAERLMAAAGSGAAPQELDLPSAPSVAIPLLVQVLAQVDTAERRMVVIADRLDLIAPVADKGTLPEPSRALLALLHRVGKSAGIEARGNMLVLLTPTLAEVHSDLRQADAAIRTIEIPPPDYTERLTYAETIITARELTAEIPLSEVARQTAGLTRRAIEDIALRATANDGKLTRQLVMDRKAELMSVEYSDVLTVVDPRHGFADVGGHELAIDYLKQWVVEPFRGDKLSDLLPMGLVFSGPSGTGKTFLAEALASEVGCNFVVLDIGRLRGGIVGESDRLRAKAFTGLEALAPCIVFMDEIDQQFRRGTGGPDSGGGGQVENSLFAALLQFFGDPGHRGRILAVAATNWPNLVDPAVMRPGRLDVKIPLLPPQTADERLMVLARLVARSGDAGVINRERATLTEIARVTDGWTQAELERLVGLARGIARIQKQPIGSALLSAKRRLKASTTKIREMTMAALSVCDDIDLVPEQWRQYVAAPMATPSSEQPPTARSGQDIEI